MNFITFHIVSDLWLKFDFGTGQIDQISDEWKVFQRDYKGLRFSIIAGAEWAA